MQEPLQRMWRPEGILPGNLHWEGIESYLYALRGKGALGASMLSNYRGAKNFTRRGTPVPIDDNPSPIGDFANAGDHTYTEYGGAVRVENILAALTRLSG